MDLYASYHLTKAIPHDVYPAISPENPDLSVKGQHILVTGGGSGIGQATAKFYAQAGAATVIITGRDSSKLDTTKAQIAKAYPQTKVYSYIVDVNSKESVNKFWAEISEKVPKIDVLINNSGVSNPGGVGTGNVDDWISVIQTNLIGSYLMSHAYVASLAKGSSPLPGTVIQVSSQIGVTEFPDYSAYAISKLGVIKLSQAIHNEHPNVRSFAVHPGIIPTAMGSVLGDLAKDTVELAAGLHLYLASPRAEFLRGRYTTANWDVSELEAHKEEIAKNDLLRVGLKAEYGPEGYAW